MRPVWLSVNHSCCCCCCCGLPDIQHCRLPTAAAQRVDATMWWLSQFGLEKFIILQEAITAISVGFQQFFCFFDERSSYLENEKKLIFFKLLANCCKLRVVLVDDDRQTDRQTNKMLDIFMRLSLCCLLQQLHAAGLDSKLVVERGTIPFFYNVLN